MTDSSASEPTGWNVEAQPFLKSILEGVAQPVWVVDHDGFIRFANPAALAALGYEHLSELKGKPSHETIHYEYPDGSHFPVEKCPMLVPLTTGETIHSDEDWFFRRDGTKFPVSYWSAAIDMPRGRGAVVAFTDIEERRQVEQALRERDAVLASIEQPVYVVDDEGVIQYANSAAVRALGYDDASELIGNEGHWLVHYKRPDGSRYPIEECPLARARETGEALRVDEDWWVRQDGSMIRIAYSAVPIQTRAGFGLALAFTDVTERKRAEEALRSSEEHLREILKGAHEAFVSMDSTGRIRAWNPAAEEAFGWTEPDAIGRTLADTIIPARYRAEHRRGLARFLATGQGPFLSSRIEIEALHRDGHEFPVELSISPVQAGNGHVFNAFLHDVSERRAAELNARDREVADARTAEVRAAQRRMIEAADAARREVARDLHDGAQQQFVNVVINLQRAQQKWTSEPDAARELLDTATQHAKYGINELRELAAGIHPSLLTTRGLLAAIEALADGMSIPVEPLEVPEERFPPAIEASVYFLVSEALTNTVKHARATRAGVRITAAGQVTVEVSDDGVGGAEAQPAGQGLVGLADRVAALDGTFTIRSEPSSGTTLRAQIPLPQSALSP
ncbi:MAG TPA: PAS domain S-box protein [Thermoleophilaceae bacterium]|nr:PAS domain S-box protein [Thermoleophilaceae bacterium]